MDKKAIAIVITIGLGVLELFLLMSHSKQYAFINKNLYFSIIFFSIALAFFSLTRLNDVNSKFIRNTLVIVNLVFVLTAIIYLSTLPSFTYEKAVAHLQKEEKIILLDKAPSTISIDGEDWYRVISNEQEIYAVNPQTGDYTKISD